MNNLIFIFLTFLGFSAQANQLPKCEYLGYQFTMAKNHGGGWYPVAYHAVGTKGHYLQTEGATYGGPSVPLLTGLEKIADLFRILDKNENCKFEPLECGIGLVSQSQEFYPSYPEYYEKGYNNEAFIRIGCQNCNPAVEMRDYTGGLNINHVSTVFVLTHGAIKSLSPDSAIGLIADRDPINLFYLEKRLHQLKGGIDLLVKKGICKPIRVEKCKFKFTPADLAGPKYTDTTAVESKFITGYLATLGSIEDESYQKSVKDAFFKAGVCR